MDFQNNLLIIFTNKIQNTQYLKNLKKIYVTKYLNIYFKYVFQVLTTPVHIVDEWHSGFGEATLVRSASALQPSRAKLNCHPQPPPLKKAPACAILDLVCVSRFFFLPVTQQKLVVSTLPLLVPGNTSAGVNFFARERMKVPRKSDHHKSNPVFVFTRSCCSHLRDFSRRETTFSARSI